MALELLNQLLLVSQLLLYHVKLFHTLLERSVILGRHLQFDVIFLQLLDLLVEVGEFSLVLLDLLLVLGNPLLVLLG